MYNWNIRCVKWVGLLVLVLLIACGETQESGIEEEIFSEIIAVPSCEVVKLQVENKAELLERPDIESINFEFDSLTHYWDKDTLIMNHYFFSQGHCLEPKFNFIEKKDSIFIYFKDESSCDLATICRVESKVLFNDSALFKTIIYNGGDVGLLAHEKNIESTAHIDIDNSESTEYDAESDYANYLAGEWSDVPNPFIAVYKGNSFGDYHHIEFEGEDGKYYDFGDGNNTYGDCELFFDDDHLTDNPKYLNKTMVVYWEWKTSTFPCCEGNYDLITAKIPSIVNLKLKE